MASTRHCSYTGVLNITVQIVVGACYGIKKKKKRLTGLEFAIGDVIYDD